MKRRAIDAAGLAETLASRPQRDMSALREDWRTLYGTEPQRYFCRSLLVYAIAYKLQEQVFGGLKRSTRRSLKRGSSVRSCRALVPIFH
jgi:hypothetical protein